MTSCNSICVRWGLCRVIEKVTEEFADQVNASGADQLRSCVVVPECNPMQCNAMMNPTECSLDERHQMSLQDWRSHKFDHLRNKKTTSVYPTRIRCDSHALLQSANHLFASDTMLFGNLHVAEGLDSRQTRMCSVFCPPVSKRRNLLSLVKMMLCH